MDYAVRSAELKEYIIEQRHYLHRHAELSYKETETTKHIADELRELGIEVTSFPDYTGCIGVIRGGKPGRTVLLRADIDALPICEKSGVAFESLNEGVMHACGHDCHAAMLLGAAKMLQENRDTLQGTVKLLFQAGEEAFYGVRYYWDNGYLSDVDAAMGMHVWPSVPSGYIAVQDGNLMASCDNFRLTVHGRSSHGARPQEGCDAIVAASNIILGLQTIVSRMTSPLEPLVVTIGSIRAGTQFNIITDLAVMEGTVRTYNPDVRGKVEQEIRKVMEHEAAVSGCTAELFYDYIEPSVCNRDLELNEIARGSARKLFGNDILKPTAPSMGSEDFSYLMEKIPSSLFVFLGCYDEAGGYIYPVHNEKFKIDEDILPIGSAEYAQFAEDYLSRYGGDVK